MLTASTSIFLISFIFSAIGLLSLYSLKYLSADNFLKKYFFVSSGKSATAAILLGGLPLAAGMMVSILIVNEAYDILVPSPQQLSILYRGIFASAILVIYGYLDDKFEIRPIAKLIFQTLTVLSFTITTTALLTGSHYSNIVFLLYSITGMALINGNNLLDGLDTLAIKTNIVSFLAFAFMGYHIGSSLITGIALSGVGALGAFYMFNKSPAKVYLGEIGGTFLGFCYLILMALYQHHEIYSTNTIKLFFTAALPITLPIMELFISFSRRILNNKSPFKGDRLHLHYILTNNLNFTVSAATSLYGAINLIIVAAAVNAYYFLGTHIAIITSIAIVSWLAINHFTCKSFWNLAVDIRSPLRTMFNSIRKNNITLIDVAEVDRFEFQVIDTGKQVSEEKKAA